MTQGTAGPALVVVAYNRPESLARLLGSLARAQYASSVSVPLIISVDGGGDPRVSELAYGFGWPHGSKEVRCQAVNLGLREHVLACGRLALDYGAVAILEEDLYVSRHFHPWLCAMLERYDSDPVVSRLGGLSLYGYAYNEFAKRRFSPLDDGHDGYFMQVASSWGQVWSAAQWREFEGWYAARGQIPFSERDPLPLDLIGWPASSWKKHFARYLVELDRYVLYPRRSLVTNFADRGQHYPVDSRHLQVPLARTPPEPRFADIATSGAVYDAYLEPVPRLWEHALPEQYRGRTELDLYGTKIGRPLRAEFLLSSAHCAHPLATWHGGLEPRICNVLESVPGDALALGPAAAFRPRSRAERALELLGDYGMQGLPDVVAYVAGYLRMRGRFWAQGRTMGRH